jgi:hypothetical protein
VHRESADLPWPSEKSSTDVRDVKSSDTDDDASETSASPEDFQAMLAMLVNAPVTPPPEPPVEPAADSLVSLQPVVATDANVLTDAGIPSVAASSQPSSSDNALARLGLSQLPDETGPAQPELAHAPAASSTGSAPTELPADQLTPTEDAAATPLAVVDTPEHNTPTATTEIEQKVGDSPATAQPAAVKAEIVQPQSVASNEPTQSTKYFDPRSPAGNQEQGSQPERQSESSGSDARPAPAAPRMAVSTTLRSIPLNAAQPAESVDLPFPAPQATESRSVETVQEPAPLPAATVTTPVVNVAAAMPTTANPIATPATPSAAPVAHQIAHAIIAEQANLTLEREHSFQMLLEPPELGRLFIQMSRGSRGLEVKISAEDEAVRSILQMSATDLQQSLQLSNLSTGQFGASMQQHSEDVFRDMLQFDRALIPNSPQSTVAATTSVTPRSSGVNMVA